jgi:S1-C subfamily serine protease
MIEKFLQKYLSTLIVGFLAGMAGAYFITTSPNGPLQQGSLDRLGTESATTKEGLAQPPAPSDSGDWQSSVVQTVNYASPAVVSIVITKDVPVLERYYEEMPGSPFDDFFFSPFQYRVPQLRQKGTEKREVGGGSGFLVSSDGMIVTNRHVVSDEEADYTVFTNDGEKHTATVMARDPANDIAVLKIDAKDVPYLEFGESDKLQVGQTTIAIGNALSEFRNTVSVGVVSGLSRSIVAGDNTGASEQLDEVIQTDAAINPGNSGGPLLDLSGKVIGVNVAVAQGSENIGFALPANAVKNVVASVQETGRIVRPYLGVRYVPVTPVLKEQNRLSVDYGVLVVRGEEASQLAVVPGSPADKAGLREGDIILEIDGIKLDENTSLANVIRKKSVGDEVSLKVLSQGIEENISATLEEVPN